MEFQFPFLLYFLSLFQLFCGLIHFMAGASSWFCLKVAVPGLLLTLPEVCALSVVVAGLRAEGAESRPLLLY